MKNKIFPKILIMVISCIFVIFSIIIFIDGLISTIESLKILQRAEPDRYQELLKLYIQRNIVYPFFTVILSILFFLVVNFKGMKFLTISFVQLIKEHREKTIDERKVKKQSKLEREIAQKQAKLDEIINTPKI